MIANLGHLVRASEALGRIQAAVDASLGDDGPGFSAARKALEDARSSVERFSRDTGAVGATEGTGSVASGGGLGEAPTVGSDAAATGPLQTRAQALQQLRVVAEFFRRTEPHSPVAYLADKAAQWGDMPLHAWLRVVLKDPSALAHVEELLGVEPPPAAN